MHRRYELSVVSGNIGAKTLADLTTRQSELNDLKASEYS
jgi:hypothetical protein